MSLKGILPNQEDTCHWGALYPAIIRTNFIWPNGEEVGQEGRGRLLCLGPPIGPNASWDSHGTAWSPSHQGRLEKSLEHLRKQMEDAMLFQAQAEETCALWQAGAGSGVKEGALSQ